MSPSASKGVSSFFNRLRITFFRFYSNSRKWSKRYATRKHLHVHEGKVFESSKPRRGIFYAVQSEFQEIHIEPPPSLLQQLKFFV